MLSCKWPLPLEVAVGGVSSLAFAGVAAAEGTEAAGEGAIARGCVGVVAVPPPFPPTTDRGAEGAEAELPARGVGVLGPKELEAPCRGVGVDDFAACPAAVSSSRGPSAPDPAAAALSPSPPSSFSASGRGVESGRCVGIAATAPPSPSQLSRCGAGGVIKRTASSTDALSIANSGVMKINTN